MEIIHAVRRILKPGINIEAYVGLVISVMIIKTGVEILRETVSSLLGERVDVELAAAVKKSILSFPEVDRVFDIVVHNYGKEKLIGSAHIEAAATQDSVKGIYGIYIS